MLGEHREHVREGFDQRNVETVDDVRYPFFEVLLEEVLKFAGKFDACGTAAYDDHVQEAFAFFGGLVFEAGGFDAVHDSLADLLGVAHFFQEAGVFSYTRDPECGILSAHAHDQHVEGNFGRGSIPFDL